MDAALAMVGTRFRHQGRQPRFWLDCAGLVVCAYRKAGIELPDRVDYDEDNPPYRDMLSRARRALGPSRADRRDGDVLVFRVGDRAKHMGIFFAGGIIHAVRGDAVRHYPTMGGWGSRIVSIHGVR